MQQKQIAKWVAVKGNYNQLILAGRDRSRTKRYGRKHH